jgi:hypothetical protein
MRLGRLLVIPVVLLCLAVVADRDAPPPGPGPESASEDKGGRVRANGGRTSAPSRARA